MGATYHFKMEMVPKWKWCQAPLCRSSSLVVSLSRQCGARHHSGATGKEYRGALGATHRSPSRAWHNHVLDGGIQ